jgi:hypothetical protein
VTDDEIVAAVRARLREGQWLLAAPATPEELAEAEQMLGFPLPPLLRRIYTEVANGGFEPFEDLDFIVENDREWRADDITPDSPRWTPGVVMFCAFGSSMIYGLLDCRSPSGDVSAMNQGEAYDLGMNLADWFEVWLGGQLDADAVRAIRDLRAQLESAG